MVRVKICGITNGEDARCAAEAGADALGFIFSSSPRQVDIPTVQAILKELPPYLVTVGVFADESAETIMRVLMSCHLDAIQLHGNEPPSFPEYFFPLPVVKAFLMKDARVLRTMRRHAQARAYLLDTYHVKKRGGTGKTFNWKWAVQAKALGKPIVLSGGLSPENVVEAVETVHPYAVDASSQLERAPGKKDHAKVREFIARAKGASAP